jgi:hypothetical protein
MNLQKYSRMWKTEPFNSYKIWALAVFELLFSVSIYEEFFILSKTIHRLQINQNDRQLTGLSLCWFEGAFIKTIEIVRRSRTLLLFGRSTHCGSLLFLLIFFSLLNNSSDTHFKYTCCTCYLSQGMFQFSDVIWWCYISLVTSFGLKIINMSSNMQRITMQYSYIHFY